MVTTLLEWRYPVGRQVQTGVELARYLSLSVQQMSLSAFYAAAITLLFWKSPRGVLSPLAPVGRMGLTTYLGQTVFGVVMFYGLGFGLLGKVGAATAIGAAIAYFFLQVALANAWAKWFRMGPAEWVWRSLTYFTLQPNRLKAPNPAISGTAPSAP